MVLLDSFHLLEICSAEIGGISSQISEFVAFEQLYGNCLDKIVRPEKGSSAKQGDTIKSETIIRLQHLGTRKWLHSHMHASPISNNLEVSCYGDDSESDKGDNWKLLIEGSGKNWKQDQKIRLQHLKTRGYLHSHDKTYSSRIVGGHHEVVPAKPVPRGVPKTPLTVGRAPLALGMGVPTCGVLNPIGVAKGTWPL